MSASPAQPEFSASLLPVKLPVVASAVRPVAPNNARLWSARPSLRTRTSFAVVRFLIAFGIGVAATLAWQSHGDVAREMIANSSPQLGWLAAQAATVAQRAPDTIAPTTATVLSPNAASRDFSALRQSVDRIAASQEQITRTVEQLTASQEQMQRQITKLQAISFTGTRSLRRGRRLLGCPRPSPDRRRHTWRADGEVAFAKDSSDAGVVCKDAFDSVG